MAHYGWSVYRHGLRLFLPTLELGREVLVACALPFGAGFTSFPNRDPIKPVLFEKGFYASHHLRLLPCRGPQTKRSVSVLADVYAVGARCACQLPSCWLQVIPQSRSDKAFLLKK